jgi:hypothetical protein
MYSSVLGRFISADTMVPDGKNPQAFNRYAYALNSPLRYNDPSGHMPCSPGHGGQCADGGGLLANWSGGGATEEAVSIWGSALLFPLTVAIEAVDTAVSGVQCVQGDGWACVGAIVPFLSGPAAKGLGKVLGLADNVPTGAVDDAVESLTDGGKAADNVPTSLSPYTVHIDPITGKGPMAIDTTQFATGVATANGGVRNYKAFWGAWGTRYGDTLSDANKALIAQGKAPIVDDVWLKYFPEHGDYLGETLVHHHLDQGSMAIPLPDPIHRQSPGYGIWHGQ